MSQRTPIKGWYSDFVPSTSEAIKTMLDLAEVKPGEMVYDIGCGYGNVLLEAQKRGARVIGVDCYLSRVNRTKKRLGGGLIVYGDIFDESFWRHKGSEAQHVVGEADVVTLFHNTTMNNILRPLLERELKPGTKVVSNCWPIDGWRTFTSFIRDDPELAIYMYKVPDSFLPISGYR